MVMVLPFATGMTACPAHPIEFGGLMVAPAGAAAATHAIDTIATAPLAAARRISRPPIIPPGRQLTTTVYRIHGRRARAPARHAAVVDCAPWRSPSTASLWSRS